ncbi:MAG TPA: rhodanese-like domain-containing protein [Chitinivibrionales bacterium]|nr:rhodanese-like domain-containing protein [Chitinivibrionales bacterium]
MKLLIIAAIIIAVAVIAFNIYKRESMEDLFSLPPGELLVIDVRTKQEYDAGHFSTALNIPYDQVAGRIGELEPYKLKTVILYCHSGNRAATAEKVLKKNGFANVVNAGGYDNISRYDRKK